MADRLTIDDVLHAHETLFSTPSLTLDACGLALTVWAVRAQCSTHGQIVHFEETYGAPPELFHLVCSACGTAGITRRCRVTDLERLTGKQIPNVGDL